MQPNSQLELLGRKAHGFDEILVSGEPEARKEASRLRHGIQFPQAELDQLRAEAKQAGVAFPDVSPTPYQLGAEV